MKTYDLICPNCEEELKMEMDPKSAEEAEIIECPECLYEAAWTHDEVTDSGYWRHGGNPECFMADLLAKQWKNFGRTWPRPTSEDEASEHDRTRERGE